jgi:hypothetical protein
VYNQSIEAYYGGCRFRTRVEARWAAFFDALRIRWQYDYDGFAFDGIYRQPDFYLPDIDALFEVQETPTPDPGAIAKAKLLAIASWRSVFIFSGPPISKKEWALEKEKNPDWDQGIHCWYESNMAKQERLECPRSQWVFQDVNRQKY